MRRLWVAVGASALAVTLSGAGPPAADPSGPAVVAIRNSDYTRREFPTTETGVQEALDFVRGQGGTVLLDSCEIAITKSLVVWDSTTIEGQGRNTVLRLKDGPASRIQALRVGSYARVANLTLIGGGYLPHDRTPYNSKGVVAGTDGRGNIRATTVEGCIFSDWNTTAIDLMGHSNQNTLRSNVISRSGWEGIYVAHYCDSNLVSGNLIMDCRRNAIDVVGAWNRILGNTVRGVGLDSLEFASDTYGILIYSRSPTTGVVTRNLVQDNIVEGCHDGIVVVCGKDSDNNSNLIETNDVFSNRRYGIWIGSVVGLTPLARVRDNVAVGNRVFRNGSSGIRVERLPRGTRLRNNEVFENGSSGVDIWAMPGGTDSTSVFGNRIHNNRGYGVEIDSLVEWTEIEGNLVSGNRAGAIRDAGRKTIVKGNRTTTP